MTLRTSRARRDRFSTSLKQVVVHLASANGMEDRERFLALLEMTRSKVIVISNEVRDLDHTEPAL